MMLQSGLDSRRVALDVCEMVIKWEQYRISQTSANVSVLILTLVFKIIF